MTKYIGHAFDHRVWNTEVPVRSPKHKPSTDELVVGSVTTSESSLLNVFDLLGGADHRRCDRIDLMQPYAEVYEHFQFIQLKF